MQYSVFQRIAVPDLAARLYYLAWAASSGCLRADKCSTEQARFIISIAGLAIYMTSRRPSNLLSRYFSSG